MSYDKDMEMFESVGVLSEITIIFYQSVKEKGLSTDEALKLTNVFFESMAGQMRL